MMLRAPYQWRHYRRELVEKSCTASTDSGSGPGVREFIIFSMIFALMLQETCPGAGALLWGERDPGKPAEALE